MSNMLKKFMNRTRGDCINKQNGKCGLQEPVVGSEEWYKMIDGETANGNKEFCTVMYEHLTEEQLASAAVKSSMTQYANWELADIFLTDTETSVINIPTNVERFGKRHTTIIRASWFLASKMRDDLGVDIYMTVFQLAPSSKSMFPFVKHDADGNMDMNSMTKQLKFQAHRFMQMFDQVVTNLTELEKVKPVLKNIGSMHTRMQRQKGFQPFYWNVFTEAMLLALRKAFKKAGMTTIQADETIELWRVVINWVIKQMRVETGSDVV